MNMRNILKERNQEQEGLIMNNINLLDSIFDSPASPDIEPEIIDITDIDDGPQIPDDDIIDITDEMNQIDMPTIDLLDMAMKANCCFEEMHPFIQRLNEYICWFERYSIDRAECFDLYNLMIQLMTQFYNMRHAIESYRDRLHDR